MDGQDEQDFSFLFLSCLSCLSMFRILVPGEAFVPQLSTSEVKGRPSSITMAFLKPWGSREAAKPRRLVPGYGGVGDFPGSGSAWQAQWTTESTEGNGNSSYPLNRPNGNWSYRFPGRIGTEAMEHSVTIFRTSQDKTESYKRQPERWGKRSHVGTQLAKYPPMAWLASRVRPAP